MNAPALAPTSLLARIFGTTRRPAIPVRHELAPDLLSRGDRIYVGRVYPLEDAARSSPTYVYERRVDTQGDAIVSTHVTRDLAGEIVLAESAKHAPDYTLLEYDLHANQLGQRGSVRVDGGQVLLRRVDDRGVRTKTEPASAPAVTGPTLIGYMVHRFDALLAGEALPVRMVLLDRLQTIGFTLQRVRAADGMTRVRMKASNFIYALAIDPIEFTFETASRKLLRLRGRVPPKRRVGDALKDFDARVEYDYVASGYR